MIKYTKKSLKSYSLTNDCYVWKVLKMAQNGSKWCFWSKWRKRPKKAKNREKRSNFGQKW